MNQASSDKLSLKPLNSHTIDLIRHRCERDVKGRILRWIGLPVGGGGALAIFLVLVVALPKLVKDTNLDKFTHDALNSYVSQALVRDPELRGQLSSIVESAMDENAFREISKQVTDLSTASVEQNLASEVEGAISNHITDILQDQKISGMIGHAVSESLQSSGDKFLRAAVREQLDTTLRRLGLTVSQNAVRTIQEVKVQGVENLFPEETIIDKSYFSALMEILPALRSAPPDSIYALRLFLAAETSHDNHYDAFMIDEYLNQLSDAAGPRFRYVLILDGWRRLISFSGVDRFRHVLRNDRDRLLDILNLGSVSLHDARAELRNLFGHQSLMIVDVKSTIQEVLRADSLRDEEGPETMLDQQIAVVEGADGARQFLGVTSRRRLLQALLP